MTGLRVLLSRVADVFLARRRDRQLQEEIQAHLDALVDDHLRQGLTPIEAQAAATRSFGGVQIVTEIYRDQRGLPFLGGFWRDLRHAVRLLRKEPGVTVVAVVALALGISVSNASFTLVNGICIRGLPIARPDRVLFVSTNDSRGQTAGLSYLDLEDLRRTTTSFVGLNAYSPTPLIVSDENTAPERVSAAYVSAGTFEGLGEAPRLGRTFLVAEDQQGAPAVAILGSKVWRSRYGADASIVGRSIIVNGVSSIVVGVMADDFRFPGTADVWLPLAAMPGIATQRRDSRTLAVFGRLKDEASMAGAQSELAASSSALERRLPSTNGAVRVVGDPINDHFNGHLTDRVWIAFMTACTLVLLVACANVANLLLTGAASRSREMAIRLSIGATRLRLVRQLLVESALLAALAGTLALILSGAAVRLFSNSVPSGAPLPYWIVFTMDTRVLSFLTLVSLGSIFAFGLAPAFEVSRVDVNAILKDSSRSATAGVRARRLTTVFLAVEFALSFVLLANIGLAVRQFHAADDEDVPIRASRLLTAWITLPSQTYKTPDTRSLFYRGLLDRVRALDGVTGATIATSLPFGVIPVQQLTVRASALLSGQAPTVQTMSVSAGYFETLGLALRRGRSFVDLDGTPGHDTAIVNERFAELFLPGRDPLQQQIQLTPRGSATSAARPWTVVGVARNVQQGPAVNALVYLPEAADPPSTSVLMVSAARGDPTALTSVLRDVARAVDPNLPLDRVMSMEQAFHQAGWNGRVSADILNIISGIAFLLSLVGLYAVTARAASQRTAEIGIRMVLGAGSRGVAWLVLRRALAQLAVGLGLGVVCTFAFRALFSDPSSPERLTDAIVLVPVAAIVVVVSAAACLVPALRAGRVDPMRALRGQ